MAKREKWMTRRPPANSSSQPNKLGACGLRWIWSLAWAPKNGESAATRWGASRAFGTRHALALTSKWGRPQRDRNGAVAVADFITHRVAALNSDASAFGSKVEKPQRKTFNGIRSYRGMAAFRLRPPRFMAFRRGVYEKRPGRWHLPDVPDPTKRALVQSQPPSGTGSYHRTQPARSRARGIRHIGIG